MYGQSYRRVISVLKSVGVVLEEIPDTNRFQIAKKLQNQNICLSMMDTLTIKQESTNPISTNEQADTNIETEESVSDTETSNVDEISSPAIGGKNRLQFWKRERREEPKAEQVKVPSEEVAKSTTDIGVILCSEAPSMTRQLNVFSNIVRRVLLFGDDQEILILSETLADNVKSFVDRWYPETGTPSEKMEDETRLGVQY